MLSLIIITYNAAGQIAACLDALAAQGFAGDLELIVVDNNSHDDSCAVVGRYPAVRLLAQRENLGFAGGVNYGVAAAHGELIALLNPDALVQPGWLAQLASALAEPMMGVVGSKVLAPDGRIQSVGSELATPLMLSAHRGDGEPDSGQYNTRQDVWAVHGAAMGFRRRVWHELGGFDAGFFPAYWEESDFCERVRRAGLRVIVEPHAVVRHTEASSTGKYSAEFYGYYHRNRLRYAAKWLGWGELWHGFRPAEHTRLATAPLLDRRVARLVYAAGVPPQGALDAAGRASVLTLGRALRHATQPNDGVAALLRLAAEAEANSVHQEVVFSSRWPLVASLRRAWNSVATRWYVRPNLEQQTRYNLALQRALTAQIEQGAADAAAAALDVALLAWHAAGDQVTR